MSTKKGALTSRFNIINWLNDLLLLPLTKIQQLGAGNVYCQLLDAAYPQKVPLNKVKWDAKTQIQFIHNFKILQNCFDHLGINKKIQVQKLVKIKYQDNLEFVQWMRTYLQDKIDEKRYQPLKRRNFMKLNLNFAKKKKFSLTLNSKNSQIFNNKQNTITQQNMRMSTTSVSSMTSSKSTLTLFNNNSRKNLHHKTKSFGPISVLAYQDLEEKKEEKQIIKMKKSSIFFSNIGIIQSDPEEDQHF